MKRLIILGALLASASSFGIGSAAAAKERPWSLMVTGGLEYDNNISVLQTDTTTGVGDSAVDLGVSAGYRLVDEANGPQIAVGYDFSQSLHFELKDFDLQTHGLSLTGSALAGPVSAGASYSFYHVLLGGESFLDMRMLNPSLSGFVAPNTYARASYIYFNKRFTPANANRDASTHQLGGTLYYFFMRSKAFVSGGARYESERTVDSELRYGAFALNGDLQLPLPFKSHPGKVHFGYEYGRWNYDNITHSIGANRWENRSTARTAAEAQIVGPVSLTGEVRYIDRRSNFSSANYTETQVLGGLKYVF